MTWLLISLVCCWVSQDQVHISRLRYEKGLEILRLLYEKNLELEHHFDQLYLMEVWQGQVSKPEREVLLAMAREALSKPGSEIAGQTQSEWGCLLESWISLETDRRIIQYETMYLQKGNEALKNSCETLFAHYVRVVGYDRSLAVCRREDDWEKLALPLDSLENSIRTNSLSSEEKLKKVAYRTHIDLEFAVDRLLTFMDRYQTFIQEAILYYQKFVLILEERHDASSCKNLKPSELNASREALKEMIERFRIAYNLAEWNGSQLKELLYGFTD